VPQPLEDIRVVDLTTGPVGGIATMVLADFGADVVKVEPPTGDRFRSLASAPLWLRGKRSVALDLTTRSDLDRLHALVATADVLVVGGPPSRAERWGVHADAAMALRSDLIHCSITGWGQAGPLAEVPGYDGAVAARSGRMLAFQRQLRRGGPVFAAVPVAGHVAAFGAVQGVLAALVARQRGSGPQRVETSLLQGLMPFDLVELLLVELAERTGLEPPNITTVGGDLPTLNYLPVQAKDGRWIQCGNLLEHLLIAFLDAIDLLGELLSEPAFLEPPREWSETMVDDVRDRILERMQERTADDWMATFRANGNVAAEPYESTQDALHHPDIVANGDVVVVDDPVLGAVSTVGPIAELSETPAVIGRPAPAVGQHTAEVLAALADAPIRVSSAGGVAADPPPPGRPLDGITVIEFATIIAGPLSTSMLADLGASVIKVELIDGDPYRHLVAGGTPAAKTTAGKASICLDLKSAQGREVAHALVARADVVVQNVRPGVAERLGLGEDELRGRDPRLIWASVTGYGPHGPSARRPSTHPCAGAAMGGAAFQAGPALTAVCRNLDERREISRQLIRANESNPDPNTSVVAATAILLALVARERFGVGQAVFVNMLAANLYANADDALDYVGKPPRPTSDPDLFGPSALYRLYPTADGWLFLAVTSDVEWSRCCAALERPDLGRDPRFADAASRTANDRAVADELAAILEKRNSADWEARFAAVRVAGLRADETTPGPFFAHHPQVLVNGFTPECTHARFGAHRRWGPIVRLDGGADQYGPGVLAGAQTDDILAGLGWSEDDLAKAHAAGVVASEPVAW
jgi:crotonobetainyl-CoA:carnitine CoA-transferase CaiB-like acyl-CoA transferase